LPSKKALKNRFRRARSSLGAEPEFRSIGCFQIPVPGRDSVHSTGVTKENLMSNLLDL
jgi:hypothetical protein